MSGEKPTLASGGAWPGLEENGVEPGPESETRETVVEYSKGMAQGLIGA